VRGVRLLVPRLDRVAGALVEPGDQLRRLQAAGVDQTTTVNVQLANVSFEKALRVVEPGVMVKLDIASRYLRSIPEGTEEIVVDCVPRTEGQSV